jgi:hypothetical protein
MGIPVDITSVASIWKAACGRTSSTKAGVRHTTFVL